MTEITNKSYLYIHNNDYEYKYKLHLKRNLTCRDPSKNREDRRQGFDTEHLYLLDPNALELS